MALEMIGDELTLVCLQLERLGDYFCKPACDPPAAGAPSTDAQTDLPIGIVHSVANQFTVGAFKYTQMEDAVAQLRRLEKAGEDEIERLMSRNVG